MKLVTTILSMFLLFLVVGSKAHAQFPTFPPCFPFCSLTQAPTKTPTPSKTPTPTGTIAPTQAVTPSPVPTQAVSNKIYYGAYVGDGAGSLTNVTNFEAQAGKGLSIVMWYQGWQVPDDTDQFQVAWMNNVRNHGSIPMITWEPWDYTVGINQPQFSLSSIINGNHDAYIRKWAQDSKAWGKPYFLRFAHEMNGNWYPWSEQANGNSAGQYVQAWRHVRDIFTQEQVTNVTWVWSANVVSGTTTPLAGLYPGDAYVDWVAMDGYNGGTAVNWGGWLTFPQVFQTTYNQISAITTKPNMVSEVGSAEQGGNKATWITNAYGSQIASMPNIKGIIWFNANREADWRITTSTGARNAFRNAVRLSKYTTNTYSGLSINPIPLP